MTIPLETPHKDDEYLCLIMVFVAKYLLVINY